MGNTHSDTPLPTSIVAHTPAQKRALSYAATIHGLLCQVFASAQPADRVLANYFRDHKKHGSKDRKVIRETLFGIFRWWGWLRQLQGPVQSSVSEPQSIEWYAILSGCALLESHPWHDIRAAWLDFAKLEIAGLSTADLSSAGQEKPGKEIVGCQALLSRLFPGHDFDARLLLPDWFWQLCEVEGADTDAFIQAMSSRPPIWGRCQNMDSQEAARQLQAQGIDATAEQVFSDALNLGHKSMNLNQVSLYLEGKLEIQDLASQVIGQICAPGKDELWWDSCSGAGGKSLQLRSLMLAQGNAGKGKIVASDIRPKALEELGKRAARANFKGIEIAPWQSDALPVPAGHFDGVLVDAPCSCTGTWRRNPDMRWIDGIDSVQDKPALQLDILSRASQAVREGGVLVYATCSLAPQENRAVVEAFLAGHDDFQLQTLTHPFNGTEADMLTIWPFEADSDGMFVARMRKLQRN
jgi:16S rRNA (cytosine967-C5)-methyltransferase